MQNVEELFDTIRQISQPFKSFQFWFIRKWTGTHNNCTFDVLDKESHTILYPDIDFSSSTFLESVPGEVLIDYEKFKQRPEYQIGLPVDLSDRSPEHLKTIYQMLLVGIDMIRRYNKKQDPDVCNHYEAVLNWLESGDFYYAPASTRFHESYKGGLLFHTLNVYNECCRLWTLDKFRSVSCDSFALVCLIHDWCKIGLYASYTRNVKDDSTGQWHKEIAYKWSDNGPAFPFGHGATSMFLASRFFNLSVEESLAIRWHMGWCNVSDNESNDLQTSNEKYPIVHMVQFADQLSIVSY